VDKTPKTGYIIGAGGNFLCAPPGAPLKVLSINLRPDSIRAQFWMLAKLRDAGLTHHHHDFDTAFARAGFLYNLLLQAEDRQKTGSRLLVQS
jgi:hypothetical protein